MKKFRFKFEAILQVRKIREGETLRALAECQRIYQDHLREKSELLNKLENALKDREFLASEPATAVAYQTIQAFIGGTKQRIAQKDQSIVRANRAVEKALRTYLIAKRRTRAIEMLYDKSFSEYKKQVFKHEQKEMDDLMIMRSRTRQEETG